jgi:hypothetical protein
MEPKIVGCPTADQQVSKLPSVSPKAPASILAGRRGTRKVVLVTVGKRGGRRSVTQTTRRKRVKRPRSSLHALMAAPVPRCAGRSADGAKSGPKTAPAGRIAVQRNYSPPKNCERQSQGSAVRLAACRSVFIRAIIFSSRVTTSLVSKSSCFLSISADRRGAIASANTLGSRMREKRA